MSESNFSPRWKLRFRNFLLALSSLEASLDYRQGDLFEPKAAQLEMERQARIKTFEYTFELAWKTLKDLLEEEGNNDLTGSKSVIRLAAQVGILTDAHIWMDMVSDRNLTTHTYDLDLAKRVVLRITNEYRAAFISLATYLKDYDSK